MNTNEKINAFFNQDLKPAQNENEYKPTESNDRDRCTNDKGTDLHVEEGIRLLRIALWGQTHENSDIR